MARCLLILLIVALTGPRPAGAEAYKFVSADGTIHFTNAPTDPRYRQMRGGSGTTAGWLRLPRGDTAAYAREIRAAAERYDVPEKLISAVIRVESAFNPRAVSRKGARGLMQLMPETASMLGVRDSFDPAENINGGVRHLRGLLDRYGNNLRLVLAAYNAGEQAVASYRGIPPFSETQDYVARVLRLFNGTGWAPPTTVYRIVGPDGTLIYTNIPSRGRL